MARTTTRRAPAAPKRTTATTEKKSTTTAAKTTTPRRRSTTAKPKTPPAPPAAAPKPEVVSVTKPTLSEPALRKRTLIDAVVEASGVKKRDAKPVVEAMLNVLGKALAEGRELQLQPMGKVKITKTKVAANGTVHTARIRQSKASAAAPNTPLAITPKDS